MREAVARDRNHPSDLVLGRLQRDLGPRPPAREYKANEDTQEWVSRMVDEIRALDPTRLVEDNSPCNYDHVENTDINSWHFYIDDYENAKRAHRRGRRLDRAGQRLQLLPGPERRGPPR